MTHKLTFKLFFSLMLFALAGSSLLFSTSSMAEARTPSKGETVAMEDVGDVVRQAVDSAIAEQSKNSRTVVRAGTLTLDVNGKTFLTQENVSLRDAGSVAEKMIDVVVYEFVESEVSEDNKAKSSVGDSVTVVVVDDVDTGDNAEKVTVTFEIWGVKVTITIEW